jgi:hypothetical protein
LDGKKTERRNERNISEKKEKKSTHRILVLVKGGLQKGSQVRPIIHGLWFWLKKIARRDLRLAQPYIDFDSS